MPKYAVVTTFNQKGYDQYAQKFIKTYLEHWHKEVTLYAYAEDCSVSEQAANLIVRNLHESSLDLVNFKNTWRNVPKANGDISQDPVRRLRKDYFKNFKWDAVRFSHKVYSIFHCADNCNAQSMIWMDSDMICHNKISISDIETLIPLEIDLGYLGREGKFPECGLYSLNLGSSEVKKFLHEFKRMYDEAETGIFLLDEWHDSFVFEEVRKKFINLKIKNWSKGLGDIRPNKFNTPGEGHPLINSEWGKFLDHLKGDRKLEGKSRKDDLKVSHNIGYWL